MGNKLTANAMTDKKQGLMEYWGSIGGVRYWRNCVDGRSALCTPSITKTAG